MDNYAKQLINRMSRLSNTVVTDEHIAVLEYSYGYYRKHRVGPLYQNLKKNTGISKKNLDRLFPHGLNSVYSWVGIPIHSSNNICKPAPEIEAEDYREVYLDHNATTYRRKEVNEVLSEYNEGNLGFGNPSSSTYLGKQAYDLMDIARCRIADCFKVKPKEIVFTSGGSEANNMAIKGIAFHHLNKKGHIITDKIEHPSVLETIKFLENIGFDVTYLDVDRKGFVSPKSVKEHLRKDTVLVSIMAANNEIGTVNPIREIGEICRTAGVPFMVDGVQAFGRIELSPKKMGISLLSISGHKIYGPKGIGALYVDEAFPFPIVPLIHGGAQEHNVRAGTENVGSIAALGKASQLVCSEMEQENERLLKLRNYFLSELGKIEPDIIVNGSLEERLPHNLSVGFPGIDCGALLLGLNHIGIYVSSGSACSSGSSEGSHVLKAIGVDPDTYGTIRFSFGLCTRKEDLSYLFKYLPSILDQLRSSF
jgi:cysteine desulfurase